MLLLNATIKFFFLAARIPELLKFPPKFSNPPKPKNTPTSHIQIIKNKKIKNQIFNFTFPNIQSQSHLLSSFSRAQTYPQVPHTTIFACLHFYFMSLHMSFVPKRRDCLCPDFSLPSSSSLSLSLSLSSFFYALLLF